MKRQKEGQIECNTSTLLAFAWWPYNSLIVVLKEKKDLASHPLRCK